ncbi:flagellar assembly protein FliH [Brevundimonas sp. 2R-24]|uniref:Flagellar assembly protein FliH n=1 Tax=Peiella sedimenti TaxID=3061083 RepID=A0ABT8SHY9_9CAUL|nr:flagellar assembly protein FliH [Caulobacteraceae bacterium XZ-24]
MNSSTEAVRPFAFTEDFGESAGPTRIRRAYTAAEAESLIAQAAAEAERRQRASDEGRAAQALADIAAATQAGLARMDQALDALRREAAELAVEAGRVLSGGALEQFPEAPVKAALDALHDELTAMPRLIVHVSADALERTAPVIEQAADEAGLSGRIVVRPDAGLAGAAFTFEWPDGRAAFDPAEAAERVREAVAAALAVKAGPITHGDA